MNVMGGKFAMNGSPLRGNEKSSGRFPLISYSSTQKKRNPMSESIDNSYNRNKYQSNLGQERYARLSNFAQSTTAVKFPMKLEQLANKFQPNALLSPQDI